MQKSTDTTSAEKQAEMDAIVALLRRVGWRDGGMLAADSSECGRYNKPVWSFGKWKVIIGRTWVTLYELITDGVIGEIESYKTDNPDAFDAELALRGLKAKAR